MGSLIWSNVLKTVRQPNMSGSIAHPATTFILDFDGTITLRDTISTLASFGIKQQRLQGTDFTSKWEAITQKYMEDYTKHAESYQSVKEERKTLSQEIDWCRSLKLIEERSFGRVSESGLFRGIEARDWESFGKEVVETGEVSVRKGFGRFIENVKNDKGAWGIVSVNFCSHFIRGVVEGELGAGVHRSNIQANVPDENGVLKYPDHPSVMATSDAKFEALKEIAQFLNKDGKDTQTPTTVYIGDSGTDIECLTAEDVIGIVMSNNDKSSLIETLRRIGLEPNHISEYRGRGTIYWAKDFQEIIDSPLFPSG